MKIIHCADLHLDSALSTSLTPAAAEQRRNEILLRFQEMIRFAVAHGVKLVLIAGDLFDTGVVSQNTRHVVLSAIRQAAEVDFLYLTGNHDELAAFEAGEIPGNLKIFTGKNRTYRYGRIAITGILENSWQEELSLRQDDLNIVVMHGQIAGQKAAGIQVQENWNVQGNRISDSMEQGNRSMQQNQPHEISLTRYAGKYIDYLALGHIHSYRQGRLDRRGTYAYCGCLEPRGFDETGEKGFVYLETREEGEKGDLRIRSAFVPFAKRKAHMAKVDITGATTTPQVCDIIEKQIAQIERKDLLKVVLTGALDADTELNLVYLTQRFSEHYFAFRIEDETSLQIDIDSIMKEDSMKGLFVRTVMAREEDEAVKRDIIRYGIKALSGEEIHT